MKHITVITAIFIIFWSVSPASADIYLRVVNGEIHLTNSPAGEDYVLVLSGRGEEGRRFEGPGELQQAIARAENKYQIPESLILGVMTAGENIGIEENNIMVLPEAVREEMTDTQARDRWYNIDRGTARLREMIGYFDGNLTLALAAYFSSIERVEEVGGIPPAPMAREFVNRSRENFEEYQGDRPALISFEGEDGVLHLISIR